MTSKHRMAKVLTLALALSAAPAFTAAADQPNTLTVHFHATVDQDLGDQITARTLDGDQGALVGVGFDGFGKVWTFSFDSIATGDYIGFTNGEDSLYPTDLRYIKATNATPEVWLIDGDPRVFAAPILVNPAQVTSHNDDGKAYLQLQNVANYLPGITFATGRNGYAWKGLAANTLNVLTTYYKGNWVEIAVDRNEVAFSAAGTAPTNSFYRNWFYQTLTGYRGAGAYEYYASFDWIDRIYSVGTLVIGSAGGNDHFLLPPLKVVYDQVMPAVTPESVGFDSAQLAVADAYLEELATNPVWGATPAWASMTVGIARHGKVIMEKAYGYNKQYGTTNGGDAVLLPQAQWQPTTVGTLFDLASNTKMYATNYAIQKLVSDGLLTIETKLADIPGFECYSDASNVYSGFMDQTYAPGLGKNTVTIRDLMVHVAGQVPDPEYGNYSRAGAGLWYQTTDYTDRTGIIEKICQTPLRRNPHGTQEYSDVDYMALGLVVELITGKTLDQYMEDEFYGPLGMTRTAFNPLENGFAATDVAATEINGNTRDGQVNFGENPPGTPVFQRNYTLQGEVHDEKAYYAMDGVAGHAGLFSTVGDLSVMMQVMLNGGVYGSRQYFSEEVRDQFTAWGGTGSYGLGWRLQRADVANGGWTYFQTGQGRGTYGHDGWTGTLTSIDPYNGISTSVLSSRIHAPSVTGSTTSFALADNPLTNRVIQNMALYSAFRPNSQDYSPVAGVGSVSGVSVAHATSEADVIAQLPDTTTVTDSEGGVHQV
ncbi:MAG: serine hydrolase, partial [Bifidobacteriaceae bacterium]|nr:serine hydrolase [Bifidobacteriaceae bacterium]